MGGYEPVGGLGRKKLLLSGLWGEIMVWWVGGSSLRVVVSCVLAGFGWNMRFCKFGELRGS